MNLQQTEAEYAAEIDALTAQYFGTDVQRVAYLGNKVPTGGPWQGAGVVRAHQIVDQLAGAPADHWAFPLWLKATKINIAG